MIHSCKQSALKKTAKEYYHKEITDAHIKTYWGLPLEKMIMGGGKSKIVLPMMVQQKATGSNLVIIEVPRALLRTNFADLNATSSRLFSQSAFLFEFNRDSDCSAKALVAS